MDLEQLIKRFFDYRDVFCEGMEVESSVLQKSDVFLPILMLLVQKAVNNTMLESIFSFNLRKKEESLCYLSIEELKFSSLDSAANIIEELIHYDQIPGIVLNDKLEVVISDFVLNSRKSLDSIPEGAFFSSDALFEILFDGELSLNLSDEFIQTQAEVLSFCEM